MDIPGLFKVLVIFAIISSDNHVTSTPACPVCDDGCQPTHPDKLNIHLVPHTHDDAGWLKTVDQYYYRASSYITSAGVQHILDSVIAELHADENRRFIYVESSFLWRWWNDRGPYHRESLRKFVREGRLQIVLGGWVMSDEATPHYSMLIDQMTVGLRFIKDILGECAKPKVAWQIDAFGHSAEVAQQFAEMGFEAVFFGRIHQDDYDSRKLNKELETIWMVNPEGPNGTGEVIFTGILYNLYHPPSGFCFDVMCHDEPIMDNKDLHSYNVDRRVPDFVRKVKSWASSYKTNHVMVPMGGDFTYMVGGIWFTNMDKLIKHGNNDSSINILYSTPYCYLKALNKDKTSWPVKNGGDFFPYASSDGLYWTGYYTSRPSLKLLTMQANSVLQAVKQIDALLGLKNTKDVSRLERAVSLLQHHDAITGTSKQHVANDYLLYLNEGIEGIKPILTSAYKTWSGFDSIQHSCLSVNISSCGVSENSPKFIIYIYNPLPREVSTFIRVPVLSEYRYDVYEDSGVQLLSEVVPVPPTLAKIPDRHGKTGVQDLVFEARNLRPMVLNNFFVQRNEDTVPSFLQYRTYSHLNVTNEEIELYLDPNFKLIINSDNGALKFIEIDRTRKNFTTLFGYYTYESSGWRYKSSGAYIFAPNSFVSMEFPLQYSIHRGINVIELHQTYSDWISQVVRIKKGDKRLEFQWLVGPIPTQIDDRSKEVVVRYITSIENRDIFYTDSNGRRFMKRKRNRSERAETNYYPATTAARIKDDSGSSLTVHIDRAQGTTSPENGILEFMLHRRLTQDDGKGVDEALNEQVYGVGLIARGKHILRFSQNQNEMVESHRETTREIAFAPLITFSTTHLTLKNWINAFSFKINYLDAKAVPANVHILTLQHFEGSKILLRLEHFYEVDEHSTLSRPATLQIAKIFNTMRITEMKEMTLSANEEKQCVSRMKWNGNYNRTTVQSEEYDVRTSLQVTLQPMEIKTFILNVIYRH